MPVAHHRLDALTAIALAPADRKSLEQLQTLLSKRRIPQRTGRGRAMGKITSEHLTRTAVVSDKPRHPSRGAGTALTIPRQRARPQIGYLTLAVEQRQVRPEY
jgi:hypothetical protein